MGRLCYPTQAPGRVPVPRVLGARKLSRCKEGMARVFAFQVQSLLSITSVAVQVLSEPRIYPRLQSWLRALAPSTRGYKLSRSQKAVKMQDFKCGQMRVSGYNNHYKFVLSAGTKAKSVTNNLPILSVLAAVIYSLLYLSFISLLKFIFKK